MNMNQKKLSLADFLYSLGFDLRTQTEIEDWMKAEGTERPVPEQPWLREWAEETAQRFG